MAACDLPLASRPQSFRTVLLLGYLWHFVVHRFQSCGFSTSDPSGLGRRIGQHRVPLRSYGVWFPCLAGSFCRSPKSTYHSRYAHAIPCTTRGAKSCSSVHWPLDILRWSTSSAQNQTGGRVIHPPWTCRQNERRLQLWQLQSEHDSLHRLPLQMYSVLYLEWNALRPKRDPRPDTPLPMMTDQLGHL